MIVDKKYMAAAIDLARRAEGMTNPNPLVGAVIVKNGKIVGRGYHKKCGMPHAEVNAIRSAGARAKGATLYVTLEPCDHYGRTPPCTDAIIKSGIKRVVIGMRDPNPITNGRGIRKLAKYGIKAHVGVLSNEAAAINKPFIKFVTKKLPYVRLKLAESIDGKIATKSGDSKWISSEESRRYVQSLRSRSDAVMVGVNTLIKDDPSLLSRIPGASQPFRVIVDRELKSPLVAKIFTTSNRHSVILATTKDASFKKARVFAEKGISVLFCNKKNGMLDLQDLLKKLSWLNVIDILVEGGGELAASLIRDRLADQFMFFICPKIIGGRDAKTSVEGAGVGKVRDAVSLKNVTVKMFGGDILVTAEPE